MKRLPIPSLTLAAAMAVLGATAPSQMNAGTFVQSYGTPLLGGQVSATSYATRRDLDPGIELSVGTSFVQRMRAFGRTDETVAVLSHYGVRKVPQFVLNQTIGHQQTANVSFVTRIMGISSGISVTGFEPLSGSTTGFPLPSPSHQVDVFGVAVGVRVHPVLARVFDLTPRIQFDPERLPAAERLSVGLTGHIRGLANCSASAWLVAPITNGVVYAGVDAELAFADTRVDVDIVADRSRHGGVMNVVGQPITLRLDAITRGFEARGYFERRLPVVTWSAPATSSQIAF